MNSTLIIIDSTSGLVHFLPVDPQTFDWDSEEIQDAVTLEGIDANNCNWMVTDNPAFLRVGWSQ